MRRSVAIAMLVGAWAIAAVATAGDEKNQQKAKVEIYDDCDPADANWDRTGGCTLEGGRVTEAEFNLLLFSPLSGDSIVGHPAWRMEPAYLRLLGGTLDAKNEGGRVHTFTEVASFGGGVVPPLNGTLAPAPECATSIRLAPEATQQMTGLTPGNHLFQCCIHPWMRLLVKVESEEEEASQGSHHHH